MSKLSQTLKACISAPHARPGTLPAPKHIRAVYDGIAKDAASRDIGMRSWLTISTAATMTMNSPDSLTELYRLTTSSRTKEKSIAVAETMREVGLKCISFNGIPRTINCLGAFRASLPDDIISSLSTTSTRAPSISSVKDITKRGKSLWDSIYAPFEAKLLDKLSQSHPDLPVHILNSHYGPLLADPPQVSTAKIGRVLTSMVAIACLRAQTGVGPQVTSHIFGLRKAYEDGSFEAEGEDNIKGGKWLASDEGNLWILQTVDEIVRAIGEGNGTTFAPSIKAKL